jgi:hypothetical protein
MFWSIELPELQQSFAFIPALLQVVTAHGEKETRLKLGCWTAKRLGQSWAGVRRKWRTSCVLVRWNLELLMDVDELGP